MHPPAPEIERVTVIGAGPMGRQIAVQLATRGLDVVLHDRDQAALDAASAFFEQPEATLRQEVPFLFEAAGLAPGDVHRAWARVTRATNPARAADCDLLLESATENRKAKRALFSAFGGRCPPATLFATNSSTLLPSELAEATGRPERFAAVHFALGSSIIELMTHAGTAPECLAALDCFARRAADVVVTCNRESRGYALNKLLMWFNSAALDLAAEGVAEPHDIDRLCMKSYGAKIGPFGTLDGVGLDTVYAITQIMEATGNNPRGVERLAYLKPYVDRGHLGKKTGKGFYTYPDPAYERQDFLAPKRHAGRFVVTAVPRSADSSSPWPLVGTAIVVGTSDVARALAALLEQRGTPARRIDAGCDTAAAVAAVDAAWAAGPCGSLLLATACDSLAAEILTAADAWAARREAGVMLPFAVCQRWLARIEEGGLRERATLVGITALGGDFGLAGRGAAAEGGAVAGLLKSIAVEVSGLGRVKVIDTDLGEPPAAVAAGVLAELAADPDEVEVGLAGGQRRVIRLAREEPARRPQRPLTPGGTWVVSGGGRGVTAIAALELARRHDLRLHLLGSSEPPRLDPRWRKLPEEEVLREVAAGAAGPKGPLLAAARKALEIDRTLAACAAAGVRATYHRCDLADRVAVHRVLAAIRKADGPIAGVIHGAGVDTTLPVAMVPRRAVEAVVGAKLDGAVALIEATRSDPLECFVGFGSTSGRFGAGLNADDGMANEMLCKLLDRLAAERPTCGVAGIHWTTWDDAGMGTRPRSRAGLAGMGLVPMPAAEGAVHCAEAIERAAAAAEIVITDQSGGIHSGHVTLANVS